MRCDRKAGEAAGASLGRSDVGKKKQCGHAESKRTQHVMVWAQQKQPISRNVLFIGKNKDSLPEKGWNFETGSEGLQRFPKNQER